MRSEPDISVVIPTRDRVDAVTRLLAALSEQDIDAGGMEVLVVDNGSRDGTVERLHHTASELPYPLRVLDQPRSGASAARNAGIAAAKADLILFLGDDTPPAGAGLVAGHVRAHGERSDPWRAVMGPCIWAPTVGVNSVMEWLERTGRSHDYRGLEREGTRLPVLYSNNVSLWRRALVEVDGFDERFPQYGWEDYDLALRLWERGFNVAFRPELLVHHEHHFELPDSLRRMESVGRTANLLHRLHESRESLDAPHPAGAKAVVGRMVSPFVYRVPVPKWLPGAARDQAFRLLHFGAICRGYFAEPLPADGGLRGGIGAAEPAT